MPTICMLGTILPDSPIKKGRPLRPAFQLNKVIHLLQQQHLLGRCETLSFDSVEIDSSRSFTTLISVAIPIDSIATGGTTDQKSHRLCDVSRLVFKSVAWLWIVK